MNKSASLIKNFLIYFIGNAGSRLTTLLLLPLFTNYLGKEEYGYFELIYSLVLFFTPTVSLQIFEGILRFLLERKEVKNDTKIIASSFYISLTNTTIFNILIYFFSLIFHVDHILLVIIFFNLFYWVNFYLRVLRGLEKKILYSIANVLTGLTILASTLIMIFYFEFNLEGIMLSYIIGYAVTLIFLMVSVKAFNFMKYTDCNLDLIKNLLLYSIPLLFETTSYWVLNLSDRIFLKFYLGDSAVGIYAVANKFSSLLLFLNLNLYMVWQDFAITSAGSKTYIQDVTKSFNILFKFQFSVLLMLIFFSKIIMVYFIGSDFQSAADYIPLLAGGAALSILANFWGMKYQVSKNMKPAMMTTVIAAALNIVLNIIFIPIIGLWGATISTFLSFFVFWFLRIPASAQFINLKEINWKLFALWIPIISLSFFAYHQLNILGTWIAFALSLIIGLIANQDQLKGILNRITSRIKEGKNVA